MTVAPGSVIFVKAGTELTGDFAVFGYGTKDEPQYAVTTYGGSDRATAASFDGVTAGLTLEQALKALGKDAAGRVVAGSGRSARSASRVYLHAGRDQRARPVWSPDSGAEAAKAPRRRLVDELALPVQPGHLARPALGDSRSRRIA